MNPIKEELQKRNIYISDSASIVDRASIVKSIFITGSRHTVNWYGTGVTHIGCRRYTIGKWLKQFEVCGKKENYTPEEIAEYKMYIDMCALAQEKIDKE